MRVMTYNILTGGRDTPGESEEITAPGDRLATVCELVRSAQPDVLVLQECNGFELDGFRTLYAVERELGMRGVLAQAQSGFHVALFVRGGRVVTSHFLQRQFHHALIAATIEVGAARLGIVGTHLCPFSGEARLLEAQHVLRFVRQPNVFVVGDLNSLSPHDAATYELGHWLPRRRSRHLVGGTGALDTRAIAALEQCDLVDTYRAQRAETPPAPTCMTRLRSGWENYQVRIDYIFATSALAARVTRHERMDGALVDRASDHHPLFVDVDL
jgi:exodeoxyribonuclease-3